MNFGARFTDKMAEGTAKTYQRLACNPEFRTKVQPTVEYFWTLFPFNLYCGICGLPCELLTFPCLWCIQIPFYAFVTIPWNAVASVFVALVILAQFFGILGVIVLAWFATTFFSTIIINIFVFSVGTLSTLALFMIFVGMSILGTTLAIVFAPGVLFYFAVLIFVAIVIPG